MQIDEINQYLVDFSFGLTFTLEEIKMLMLANVYYHYF